MKRLGATTILLSVCTLLLYQNCSEISLMPIVPAPSVQPFRNSGEVCTLPPLSARDKVKLIFVVDMSASNVFNENVQGVAGSDLAGDRFRVIEDFVSQNCVSQNEASRAAVVGFANTKKPDSLICNKSHFTPFSNIGSQLDVLRDIEDNTKADCNNGGGGQCNSFTTNYNAGLECAKQIVQNDIQTPDADGKRSFYMVFFLTDGEPRVTTSFQLGSTEYNNYKNIAVSHVTQMRNLAEEDAFGLQMQPIFYGRDYLQRADPSGSKQLLADDILTAMADAGMTEYTSLDEASDINLCQFMRSGTRVPYRMTQFVVANLTAVKMGSQIYADSDMDGIPDHLEVERGFDPQKPRSMLPGSQLLDGACGGLPAAACVSSAHQSCGEPNLLGMTICEINKLGLQNGIDSDRDGFVDIMELIKGTPANDDADIVDGDSLNAAEELLLGRDPNVIDDNTPADQLVRFTRNLLADPLPGCPLDQESIAFEIQQVPLVKTKAVKNLDPLSAQQGWRSHEEDENVILIYYVLTPANQEVGPASELKPQVFGQFLKVPFFAPRIQVGDFIKLGEVGNNFEESK